MEQHNKLVKRLIQHPNHRRLVMAFHHYIPQFFLEGFSNNGQYWLYDKLLDSVDSHGNNRNGISYAGIRSTFGGVDENSFPVNNIRIDSLEKMYSRMEKSLAFFLRDLIGNAPFEFKYEHKVILEQMMLFTLWRIPRLRDINEPIAIDFLNTLSPQEVHDLHKLVAPFNQADRKRLVIGMIPVLMGMDAQRSKINEIMRAIAIYEFQDISLGISDFPILFSIFPKKLVELNCPFIFPLSANKCLVATASDNHIFSNPHVNMTNIIMLHQSKRYFAMRNRKTLLHTIAKYKQIMDKDGAQGICNLRHSLFVEVNEKPDLIVECPEFHEVEI
jgi:hypothetical protein